MTSLDDIKYIYFPIVFFFRIFFLLQKTELLTTTLFSNLPLYFDCQFLFHVFWIILLASWRLDTFMNINHLCLSLAMCLILKSTFSDMTKIYICFVFLHCMHFCPFTLYHWNKIMSPIKSKFLNHYLKIQSCIL